MLSVTMLINWLHSYKKKRSQNQSKAVHVREPLKNYCKEMGIFQSTTTQTIREVTTGLVLLKLNARVHSLDASII